jgi:hypothetical protein
MLFMIFVFGEKEEQRIGVIGGLYDLTKGQVEGMRRWECFLHE